MPYRIKHKQSGLYFVPNRWINIKLLSGEYDYVKSNLSPKGKLYHHATLKWLKHGYYSHLCGCPEIPYGVQRHFPFVADEWEIEDFSAHGDA